jgi:hypothetical protein
MAAVAAVVLGTGPFAMFFSHHLPQMASGEAFAYTEQNFDNHSPYGVAFKLAALGVGGATRTLASTLAWMWTAVAVGLAIVGSRRSGDRGHDAMLWLGIVCLATLRSPFAPAYTAVGTLWLLAIGVSVRGWSTTLVAIAWFLVQGTLPIGDPATSAILSLPSQAISIAIAVLAVWPRSERIGGSLQPTASTRSSAAGNAVAGV